MPRLSVIIPARNERFLPETIFDLLSHARGDIEVIAGLDGYWPNPPLPDDSRLHILHAGAPLGMRPMINAMASMARGKYLMKVDGHCRFSEGYDEILTKELEDETVVVPRRYGLDPDTWEIKRDGKYPIDMHYLSYPFAEGKQTGLHGNAWPERAKTIEGTLLEEMSSQGSCWVMAYRHWKRVGDLDAKHYGQFIQEFQEVGLRTWLRGNGRVLVNRNAWYAHLHKGPTYVGADGRTGGRGYFLNKDENGRGANWCTDYWMNNRWSKRTRDIRWLIEHFWPVPTWPVGPQGSLDWDQVERDKDQWNRTWVNGRFGANVVGLM
jgi:hypothetical protein